MKKKNRSIALMFLFLISPSILIANISSFTKIINCESPKTISESILIGKNEGSKTKVDQQTIDAILNAKAKNIEFSDSKKYETERNTIYNITNMAESEKYCEGSMKKGIIRVALEDLNDDGIKEILAYIIQFEWCGKGGGYCTFLILQKKAAGNWRELLDTSAYEGDIGILDTQHKGYADIAIKLVGPRDGEAISIYRWNGTIYQLTMKREIIYDVVSKKEKIILWRWDNKTSSWGFIKEIER